MFVIKTSQSSPHSLPESKTDSDSDFDIRFGFGLGVTHCSFLLQISELFGGMEVCAVSVVVGKDGKEHIISACDSTFALIGDSQEEDRRQIADLVTSRMTVSLVS